LGAGYGHLAFCVDDLDAEHARFESAGFNPRKIVEFNRDGALLARFFFIEDPDGYKIEVLQKHGRYR
jgi:lactoylglutathione lyase